MITLTLLHPVQSTPVQSWSFDQDPVIQIGRAVDNHVVLYSAVVSRYHVELRLNGQQWEVVNQGTNGTYLDGKRVHQAPLKDGSILRLARSGPNIQIRLGSGSDDVNLGSKPTQAEAPTQDLSTTATDSAASQNVSSLSAPPISSPDPRAFHVLGQHAWPPRSQISRSGTTCQHLRAKPSALVCIDCGLPLNTLQILGEYQVLRALGTREQSFIAWREGHVVVLKKLNQTAVADSERLQLFRERAQLLCDMSHPGMPKIYEAFEQEGHLFLVSEMIYGQNLKQLVGSQGPLSQQQVAAWAIDVCHLLGYLHERASPVIHQSVKPSNLIRPTIPHGLSQVVLVNFGELSVVSEAGTDIGSVAYTAPEQQTGQPSSASDLYSLGATMVYLLTQQEPDAFYRLDNQTTHLAIEDIPSLSAEMAQILRQLTHPNPAERYESALSAAETLQPLAA